MRLINTNLMFLDAAALKRGKDETLPLAQAPENVWLLSCARDGLSHIAKTLPVETKRVMIPAYTCDTVALPFTEEGWTCNYFAVDEHMRIDAEHFRGLLKYFKPDVVVMHPFYGMDLNESEQALLKEAHDQGCFVVEDLTHSLFSSYRYDFVDAYVGSVRKWINIPDGGFYESTVLPGPDMETLEEREDSVKYAKDQLYLRDLWRKTGDENLRLIAGRLDKLLTASNRNGWGPYRMSDFSRRLLVGEDPAANNAQRLANARYLYEKLKDSKRVKMPYTCVEDISTGPLWFPVYVTDQDRKALQKEVFKPNGVTAIGLWPLHIPATAVNDTVQYIYDHILVFPCGQMYNEEDMQYIVDLIERT